MLRVGLTGGLGSGKSTAGQMLARCGAHVLEADAIGRAMMQPGQPVYAAVVERFGKEVLLADGRLDRAALARIAFAGGRVDELNAIVHPAVIARQAEIARQIFADDWKAVVVVESALIFETKYGETKYGETQYGETSPEAPPDEPWRNRFDCIVLVAAPEEIKIARYLERAAAGRSLSDEDRARLVADAKSRLAQQIPDDRKAEQSDFIVSNEGSLEQLEEQIDDLWPVLAFASANSSSAGGE